MTRQHCEREVMTAFGGQIWLVSSQLCASGSALHCTATSLVTKLATSHDPSNRLLG